MRQVLLVQQISTLTHTSQWHGTTPSRLHVSTFLNAYLHIPQKVPVPNGRCNTIMCYPGQVNERFQTGIPPPSPHRRPRSWQCYKCTAHGNITTTTATVTATTTINYQYYYNCNCTRFLSGLRENCATDLGALLSVRYCPHYEVQVSFRRFFFRPRIPRSLVLFCFVLLCSVPRSYILIPRAGEK